MNEDWGSRQDIGRERGPRVEIECEGCDDIFQVIPSKSETARFCSRNCRETKISLECKNCKIEYSEYKHREDRSDFCSRECYYEWMRSEEWGGKDHPNWKGGGPWNYGPNWDEQSRKARRRDQHRCQDCGITEPEHLAEYGCKHPVHHITPIREFRDDGDLDHEAANDLDNLITLCDGCHPKWDQVAPLRLDTTSAPADD